MKIFVEFDLDRAEYTLMVDDGRMSPMPAGERLYRGGAWPTGIQFTHGNLDDAEKAALLLRAYLAALPGRRQTKKELREVEA